MKLKRALFGNPLLRKHAKLLTTDEILSDEVQKLIADMYEYLDSSPKFGVGIAAPQLGQDFAISVISIKSMPHHPDVRRQKLTIINPEIIKYHGRKASMWEGCISFGGSTNDFPYAQTMRYKKVTLRYIDELGITHERDFTGMLAHVVQHETDHLHGILFVDRVKDTHSYCMKSEYIKNYLKGAKKDGKRK